MKQQQFACHNCIAVTPCTGGILQEGHKKISRIFDQGISNTLFFSENADVPECRERPHEVAKIKIVQLVDGPDSRCGVEYRVQFGELSCEVVLQ